MSETALQRSIDHAYSVFGSYRLRGKVDVCNCPNCLQSDAERHLLETPLRQVSSSLLASYSHAAKPTDPEQVSKSLRYFLPRYFELIAAHDWPVHVFEAGALKALAQAQYRRTWPAHEVAAVDEFFEALFRATLSKPVVLTDEFDFLNQDCLVATILGLVIGAGGDVGPLLADWDLVVSESASLHLALLILRSQTSLRKNQRLRWAYDDGNAGAEKTILGWLARPMIKARIGTAFFETRNPVRQAVFSNAEAVLAASVQQL